jgi:hypothetical protein
VIGEGHHIEPGCLRRSHDVRGPLGPIRHI